jgi:cytochrome c556
MAGALAVLAGASVVSAQHKVTGLTGIDRADDVIQARQIIMSGVEHEMMVLDLALGGREIALAELQARAFTIFSYLSAFPHLFPPETMPAADGSNATSALPSVWDEFTAFYDAVQQAANVALDASQAKDMAEFKPSAGQLRAACDSCHARYMRP